MSPEVFMALAIAAIAAFAAVATAYRRIAVGHRLAEDISQRIAKLDPVAARTIKAQFRDRVAAEAEERPRITAKHAMNPSRGLEP